MKALSLLILCLFFITPNEVSASMNVEPDSLQLVLKDKSRSRVQGRYHTGEFVSVTYVQGNLGVQIFSGRLNAVTRDSILLAETWIYLQDIKKISYPPRNGEILSDQEIQKLIKRKQDGEKMFDAGGILVLIGLGLFGLFLILLVPFFLLALSGQEDDLEPYLGASGIGGFLFMVLGGILSLAGMVASFSYSEVKLGINRSLEVIEVTED